MKTDLRWTKRANWVPLLGSQLGFPMDPKVILVPSSKHILMHTDSWDPDLVPMNLISTHFLRRKVLCEPFYAKKPTKLSLFFFLAKLKPL